MKGASIWVWLAATGSMLGCELDISGTEDWCESLLGEGAVVISEVFANPEGKDGDGEYFEVFNPSTAIAVDLTGLELVSSRADGSVEQTHRFGPAVVEPQGYLVLGNASLGDSAGHIDYSYGSSLGNLRNSDARIALRCGDVVVDEVTYEGTRDGLALQLDGRSPPDHFENDSSESWCFSDGQDNEFIPGNFGTPGARNRSCAIGGGAGTCLVAGEPRPIAYPGAGDVFISEWMPNPDGRDRELEWVEIFFAEAADLAGLELGDSEASLAPVVEATDCLPVEPSKYLVLGSSPTAAERVDAPLRISLPNSGERTIVIGAAGQALDRVEYRETKEGIAWQVDAEGTACLVDETAREYTPGNFGTPGEANPLCPLLLESGTCLENGAPRSTRKPVLGDVRITEWMANPTVVSDSVGEWFEIEALADIDLNGLWAVDAAGTVSSISTTDCIELLAGTSALFARSLDETRNGGLRNAVTTFGFSLNNGTESISIGVDDLTLDSVGWTSSVAGAATQIDQGGTTCTAFVEYADGALGTPGLSNPPCP